MFKELRSAVKGLRRSWMSLLKYLIVTKALQFLVLFPLFWWLAGRLFAWRGLVSLNSANAAGFLLSTPGLLFALLTCGMLLLTLLIEIGGFVTLSATAVKSDVQPGYRAILGTVFRSFRTIIGPGLVVVLALVLVVMPLTDSILNVSFLSDIRIPNFITSVILAHPVYRIAYWVLLAVLHVVAVLMMFLFHFMLLGHLRFGAAARASARLVKRNLLRLVGFMLMAGAFLGVVVTVVLLGIILLLNGVSLAAQENPGVELFLGTTCLLLIGAVIGLTTSLLLPSQLYLLTNRYYTYLEALPDDDALRPLADKAPVMEAKTKPSVLDRVIERRGMLVAVFLVLVLASAGIFTVVAGEVTKAPNIAVVGHRGGPGDTAVENTREAIEQSIAAGAQYVEVDIQRTLDGQYIVFHDNDFSRFTSDRRSPQEMTFAEIKALDLGEKSGGRYVDVRVLSMNELFELTRGRIGIFLELKGKSADTQMADDAVSAVKEAGMLDQVVVMSLDYGLIEHIEHHHPEVVSGFTYFLSLGNTSQLTGDYLILEEGAASAELIDQIHAVGKRAAVWTVNTEDSMERFVNWPVDAVITDYVDDWQRVAEERRHEDPLVSLARQLFG